MYPNDFELYVKQRCLKQRELLEKKWIPTCAQAILELKENWKNYVPHTDDESLDLPMKFFAAISSEMSNQLRELVYDSLAEFVEFIEQYGVLSAATSAILFCVIIQIFRMETILQNTKITNLYVNQL